MVERARGTLLLLTLAATWVEVMTAGLLPLVPYLVLGLAGGLVAAFRVPRPSYGYVALSMMRSALMGLVTSHLLIGFDVQGALVLALTVLSAYLAEELLSGIAKIAATWADRPLYTLGMLSQVVWQMRQARGMHESKGKGKTDVEDDQHDR